MLAVVAIIAILLSILTPTVNNARKSARQSDCRSNLRQFGIALTVYRADHAGRNPPWMSSLYPQYIDARDVFVCKSDAARGKGPIVPERLRKSKDAVSEYPETIDNDSVGRHSEQNRDVAANSYFYEFSAANCSWKSGKTWNEAKEEQLRYGDEANGGGIDNPVPYSTSRMPIIRCWHHWSESRVRGYMRSGDGTRSNSFSLQPLTLNVAYAGNVFVSPPWWEGRIDPGEGK